MKKGILIFAHNSREIDYLLLAVIAGGLASKNLRAPVSLVTDLETIEWAKKSDLYKKVEQVFEHIIFTERPSLDNSRLIYDGLDHKFVPFINSSRSKAWDLTPYDRTLLIDSDYLIFTDMLSHYWEVEQDLLIAESMNDIRDDKKGFLDTWISDVGIEMLWATSVMFTKNNYTKVFFDLVDYIRENYNYYSDIYRYDTKTYRNDIAFSISNHILEGFQKAQNNLPAILTVFDKDELYSVEENSLKFLIRDFSTEDNFFAVSLRDQDVHVMNKQSLIRNKDGLLKLI